MNHNIHFGVTGLRRTGKTVFLTSLIYQLAEVGDEGLSAFSSRGVQIKTGQFGGANGEAKFPFQKNLRNLRYDPPTWPPPTRNEFEGTLTFRYRQIGTSSCSVMTPLLSRIGWGGPRQGTITLHLHDYPGEFLLDVELADLSFQQWSEQILERMQDQCPQEYVTYAKRCRELVANHLQGLNAEALASLRTVYTDYVQAARDHQFELIQPGIAMDGWDIGEHQKNRPVDPGPEVLPILPIDDLHTAPASLVEPMEQEYRRYVEQRVQPFVTRLRKSTHQLVLVDVLRVLRALRAQPNGHQCYNDTRECLARIIGAYRYAEDGVTGATKRLLWGGVHRIVFAATKADHVLPLERNHLTLLLQELVKRANGRVPKPARFCWFTSLRATEDRYTNGDGGEKVEVLWGKKLGDEMSRGWNPGHVPRRWRDVELEADREIQTAAINYTEFPEFAPPQFPKFNGTAVPHLNLDDVLWHLLEECF